MCPSIVRARSLLEEVSRYTSRIATAMFVIRVVLLSATIGSYIILHAYHSVGMMMEGNDGYHQHYQADEKKNIGYVLFLFHSSIFGRMQR